MSEGATPYEPLWSTYQKVKRTREIMQARLSNGTENRPSNEKKAALDFLRDAEVAMAEAFDVLFPESPNGK